MKNKWVSIDKATKAQPDVPSRCFESFEIFQRVPCHEVCTPSVESVEDAVQKELSSLSTLDKAAPLESDASASVTLESVHLSVPRGEAKLDALKKRKLIAPTSLTAFKVGRFSPRLNCVNSQV